MKFVLPQSAQHPWPVAKPWRTIQRRRQACDRIEHLLGADDLNLLPRLLHIAGEGMAIAVVAQHMTALDDPPRARWKALRTTPDLEESRLNVVPIQGVEQL